MQLQKADPPAEVIESFRDVQRARSPTAKSCATRPSVSYRNDIANVPKARGAATQLRQDADAYRSEIVARSQGDADRFTAVYKAYKVAEDVTALRLYLETIEEILKNGNKIIIEKGVGGQSGVLPYLPLPSLPGFAPPAQPASPSGSSGSQVTVPRQ